MARSPHDTHHTVGDDWPLSLGVDDRGRSIHVCRDCGDEIPDGVTVERDNRGRVVAYSPDPAGDRTMHHQCRGRRG